MTFAYTAGDAEPDFSGLLEFRSKSLRICNVPTGSPLVEPTFKPLLIPPLVATTPIRYNVTPVPRNGAFVSDPIVDSWQFDVTGWFLMDDVDDVGAAFEYLCDVVSVANGQMVIELDDPSWTERRIMTVQKAGPVAYGTNPDKGEMAAGYREFVLPLIASDPIKYSLTSTDTVISGSTAVLNDGNAKVPYAVKFDGAVTDHIQIDTGGSTVLFDHAMSSGDFVTISTVDGSYVSNMGIDLNPYISIDAFARLLAPGSNVFTMSSGGGGTATITSNSGWE